MNGIEKITAHIISDAEAEAAVTAEESRAQCEALEKEYDQKAQEEYSRIIKAGTAKCEDQADRTKRTAGMEARKSILAEKQDMVSRAFDKAEELMGMMPESLYVPFLAKQAAAAAFTGEEEVIFNERDRAGCGKAVVKQANALLAEQGRPATLTLSALTRNIKGGLVLKQGDIEVNCSIEILTEGCRSRLAAEVAGVLFE